jgi:hypothetical protein
MYIPAWRVLEKAILQKHVLTIPDPDENRTKICLHTVPLLFCIKSLRHIECIAYYRSSY